MGCVGVWLCVDVLVCGWCVAVCQCVIGVGDLLVYFYVFYVFLCILVSFLCLCTFFSLMSEGDSLRTMPF